MTIDDSARPRFLPLTTTRRLEVDYSLDAPTVPVAMTVVDRAGREIRNDGEVVALAWRLTKGRQRPRTLLSALRVLLTVALRNQRERQDAERARCNLAQAEEHDAAAWVDAPIEYDVVDQPAERDGVDDPERPEWRMDDEHVNAFASEPLWRGPCASCGLRGTSMMSATCPRCSHPTGRVLRSLDRAAGAR